MSQFSNISILTEFDDHLNRSKLIFRWTAELAKVVLEPHSMAFHGTEIPTLIDECSFVYHSSIALHHKSYIQCPVSCWPISKSEKSRVELVTSERFRYLDFYDWLLTIHSFQSEQNLVWKAPVYALSRNWSMNRTIVTYNRE